MEYIGNSQLIDLPRKSLASIDGCDINTENSTDAIAAVVANAKLGIPSTLFTLNLDHLVKMRRNSTFRRAYENATIVTADGAPIAWLARKQHPHIRRATGADMLLPLLKSIAENRIPVALFGSSPPILLEAKKRLQFQTDQVLIVVDAFAPTLSFDPEGEEADKAIARLIQSKARVCIVALGAPKQEIFSERMRALGVPCVMLCVGASLDFIVGAQKRAPKFMRRAGLEWIWRLAHEPKRLAKRYWDCCLVLTDLVVTTPIRRYFSAQA